MRRGIAATVMLGAILIGCAARIDYDPARLTVDRMEQIVASPMQAVRSGDLAEAERRLARLRRQRAAARTNDPYAVADVDESFGILLVQEQSDDVALRRAALPYLARAIAEVRAAKGPNHPEVALALHTYGDALLRADRANAPAARRAFCAAYRIRRSSLGPGHRDTGAALAAVARLEPQGRAAAALQAAEKDARQTPPIALLRAVLTDSTIGQIQHDRMLETIARDLRFIALCHDKSSV